MATNRFHSLTAQSIYVILTGLQLIFTPNLLLGMFGFEPTTEVWIKVLGIVILPLSLVYMAVAKSGNHGAIRATVFSRLFVGAGFVLLAVFGQAKMNIILFAGIDIATAVWTWFELKRQNT